MVSMYSWLVSTWQMIFLFHSDVGVMRYLYDSKFKMDYFLVKAHPVVFEPLHRLTFRNHVAPACVCGLCDHYIMKLVYYFMWCTDWNVSISSVVFCVSALIAFIVSVGEQMPEMSKLLGWAFYICCATLVYASLVSVALGFVEGSSSIEPANPDGGQGLPAPAMSP